jgi:hypothetical protein
LPLRTSAWLLDAAGGMVCCLDAARPLVADRANGLWFALVAAPSGWVNRATVLPVVSRACALHTWFKQHAVTLDVYGVQLQR